jgi:hypothetical protein
MQKKLTLRMDEELIERAKEYAKGSGKSVSRMVEDYFALLTERPDEPDDELPPITRSLKGAFGGGEVTEDDYYKYLEEKYS